MSTPAFSLPVCDLVAAAIECISVARKVYKWVANRTFPKQGFSHRYATFERPAQPPTAGGSVGGYAGGSKEAPVGGSVDCSVGCFLTG
jgi:hypothetical protein